MDRLALIIAGHGSRDAAANAEFEALVERYRQCHAEVDVTHGYIELAQPNLTEALAAAAQRARRVAVLPLFLFAAGHVKNDIPLALEAARRQFPQVEFSATHALGVPPLLAQLAYERAASVAELDEKSNERTALIVVGRGASDPDANGEFYKTVRMLSEGRRFGWVLPSFIGITRPSFEESCDLMARARPERIIVVPYFLFGGRLITKLQEQVQTFTSQYPWIRMSLAPHLGIDDKVIKLMDERVSSADFQPAGAALPCDNCQYRTPLPGLAGHVGGLKAMLWSARHSYVHAQAVPHIHAHKPIKKHVLVCGNVDCADRGSISLIEMLRRTVKDAGQEQTIRVTRTSCMGRCGEGPTVAIYPDGIGYRGVQEQDAQEIVEQHLLQDRLVARLVDNIMH